MRFIMAMTLLALQLALTAGANAQDSPGLITGTVTEKANLELMLFKKINKKTEMLAEYKITPENTDYAFAVPTDKAATYHLMINVMKQGHLRLESEKMLTFPLTISAGKVLGVNITPSQLDTIKKTGLSVNAAAKNGSLCRVGGVLTNSKVGGPVSLLRVVNGQMEKIASFNTSGSNLRFELAVPVKEEGFYYLSTLRWRARIYLKPSDELEVSADVVSGKYSVIKGSEENKWMEKWQNLSWPITSWGYNINVYQNGINLDQYFVEYEKLQPAIVDFKQKNGIANQNFKKLFYQAIDIDNALAPMYLFARSSSRKVNSLDAAPRNGSEPPSFYRQFIGDGRFDDAAMLRIGETMQYLQLYGKLRLSFMPERKNLSAAEQLKIKMDAINNETIRW